MKSKSNTRRRNPTKHKLTTLDQLSKLIPGHLFKAALRESGLTRKYKFTVWSHMLTMMFAHLSRTASLWDLCANLLFHTAKFSCIRGAYAPSRNALSNANRKRPALVLELLYWKLMDHYKTSMPEFDRCRRYLALSPKFKRAIHAVDSSTIPLVLNCIDWAKHRRRKAAAKLHLRLNLGSFLPEAIVIEAARGHDVKYLEKLCANVAAGAIIIADRAYLHFKRLYQLDQRGVFWVLRKKTNVQLIVRKKRLKKPTGNILRDDLVIPKVEARREDYPGKLRLIRARVLVEGRWIEMEFITNNFKWSPQTIVDLYQARWGIEVFFKELKQGLKLKSFLGYNQNAICWQIWTALILRLLMRVLYCATGWQRSFGKLMHLLHGVLWDRYDLYNLCAFYGTAGGDPPDKPDGKSNPEQFELTEKYPPFDMGKYWDSKRRKWFFQMA